MCSVTKMRGIKRRKTKKSYLEKHKVFDENSVSSQEEIKKIIYITDDKNAYVSYFIRYLITSPKGDVARPTFIVNESSGEILKFWDSLAHTDATGPGGNIKTGQYEYGIDYDFLNVAQI